VIPIIPITTIGFVENKFSEPVDHEIIRKHESVIQVKPEYAEGLYRLEESEYIQVVFGFDRAEGYTLKGPRRQGHLLGVFASRSPNRPSALGVTVVRLLAREGTSLRVRGLDALDGTPVLDIKPHTFFMDHPEEAARREELRANPRAEVNRLVVEEDWERLLLKSAELHGYCCPLLALGVRAGAHALLEVGLPGEGDVKDYVAVVETDTCFSDGIQYVTGCTFGNGALIYRDCGKLAVTLATRRNNPTRSNSPTPSKSPTRSKPAPGDYSAVRVCVTRRRLQGLLREHSPEATRLAFELVSLPAEELFNVETDVTFDLSG